jgi:hypothetical protein
MTTTTLPSANEDWGFFGTMQHGGADPMQSWNAASAIIAVETGASPEGVRAFLDSRPGRHFADDVLSRLAEVGPHRLEEAIEATVARWQAWRIGRQTSRRGDSARASLPDRLGRPLRDPRRHAGLTSPLRRLAAHLRGYAALGS